MGAYENKQSAEDAYAAFGKGDARERCETWTTESSGWCAVTTL